jgi:hypothetical protein
MPLSDADLESLRLELREALTRPLSPEELEQGQARAEQIRQEQDPQTRSVIGIPRN